MSEFKTVRGMRDFLPREAKLMRHIEDKTRFVAELHGYKEVLTPLVESYELLSAKAGEEVRSRMFVFEDLGGRNVALRPEFTSSIARLIATTLKNEPKPLRLFCVGSLYRYDEPQLGRYREFWQSNYELIGSKKPDADAEILILTRNLMKASGLKKFGIKIGHVGVLRSILNQEELEDDIQNRILQLMDKKRYDDAFRLLEDAGVSEKGRTTIQKLVKLRGNNFLEISASIVECVADYEKSVEAATNLSEILELIVRSGYEIEMTLDAGFARGLEYYTGMIFEIYVPDMNIALGGGGRYDRLVELFGGEPTPAVGVAHGIDRIMLAMQRTDITTKTVERKTTIVIPLKEKLRSEALRVSRMLWNAGISAEVEVMGRKIAKALEDADRRRMTHAIIVGEREIEADSVVLRDLTERKQSIVKIERIAESIRGKD